MPPNNDKSLELNKCYIGDCREGLRAFVAAGLRPQMCVTSPPYWGLRDYGIKPSVWGGLPDCEHVWGDEISMHKGGPTGANTGLTNRGAGWRNKQNASFSGAVNELVDKRNRRSVWTVQSEPFSDAHFATFPRRLIEPCILAGSRPGDIVLDPFMGSGTTAQVAEQLGRKWLGCEINPDYVDLQANRLRQQTLELGSQPTGEKEALEV